MEDKCLYCGAVVPEGRMICPQCENNKIFIARESMVETACLICGEGVPTTFGNRTPKICEKCKDAVMKVREQYGI